MWSPAIKVVKFDGNYPDEAVESKKGDKPMRKNIVYIAGKITDEPNFKINFKLAEQWLKELGFTVLNPAELPKGLEYEQYMSICFAMIDQSDIVFLLDNYRESPGALRELERAKLTGKIIIGANYDGFD